MSELAKVELVPTATLETVNRIESYEVEARKLPQIHIQTEHLFHAGMYARTIRLEPRVAITSVFIKIPTVIVINGACEVYDGRWRRVAGYNVVPASAGRKMVYVTETQTEITMLFPSKVKTVKEAEEQFTDETDLLLSHACDDDVVIVTGVDPCQV